MFMKIRMSASCEIHGFISCMLRILNRLKFIVKFLKCMENMQRIIQWYVDGCDFSMIDVKIYTMNGAGDHSVRFIYFWSIQQKYDYREHTIYHYTTFPAFSTYFTLASSRNCVWETLKFSACWVVKMLIEWQKMKH